MTGISNGWESYHPQQIEFDRLNLTYTLLSKRKLLTLVQEGHVTGWDDPRMPTISGIRRRGYTPEAICNFCNAIGVSKTNGMIELGLLEHFVREDLNKRAPRVMAVLHPLRLVIDNYPADLVEEVEAVNNPEDASAGTRKVPFSRVLYIEHEDFREDPPKQFYRLSPGREVRLRYGYFVTCRDVVKDETGQVIEIHCTYDPALAAARRTGEKSNRPYIGFRPRMPSMPRCACTITCSPKKIPMRRLMGRTSRRI